MTERETRIAKLVEEQANDPGCWFVAQTVTEAYLQRQLRLLHAAIEGTDFFGIPLRGDGEPAGMAKRGLGYEEASGNGESAPEEKT